MSMSKESPCILLQRSVAEQNLIRARMAAKVDGIIAPAELDLLSRFAPRMENLSQTMTQDDPHPDDDEAEVERKQSEEVQAAQTARGTQLTQMGSDKAAITKRAVKALDRLMKMLTPDELKFIQSHYAAEYNKVMATNDPRLFVQLIEIYWAVSSQKRSLATRLAHAFSAVASDKADVLTRAHAYRLCCQAFDGDDGDTAELGWYSWLAGLSQEDRAVLSAVDRRFINHPTTDGAAADGYAYLDGLSHDAYVSLCDEEAKLMPSPRTANECGQASASAAAASEEGSPRTVLRASARHAHQWAMQGPK